MKLHPKTADLIDEVQCTTVRALHTPVELDLEPDLIQRLQQIAASEQVTVEELIQRAIAQGLDRVPVPTGGAIR